VGSARNVRAGEARRHRSGQSPQHLEVTPGVFRPLPGGGPHPVTQPRRSRAFGSPGRLRISPAFLDGRLLAGVRARAACGARWRASAPG